MFENAKIVRKADISEKEKQKITQSYNYLRSYPNQLPDWLSADGVMANFGFESTNAYDERIEIWCNYQGDTLENGLDLSDYSYILRVSASDSDITKDGMFEFNGTDGHSFSISKQAVYDYAKKCMTRIFRMTIYCLIRANLPKESILSASLSTSRMTTRPARYVT